MMLRRLAPIVLLLAFPAAPRALAAGPLLEATVDVPRDAGVPLDLVYEKAALVSVESQNDPQAADVKDAERGHPNDITLVLIRFHYRNGDYVKHKVKLRVVLLDEAGGVLGEGGRGGTLDASQTDDTLTFPLKVKTLDWPKAAKMRVFASFLS